MRKTAADPYLAERAAWAEAPEGVARKADVVVTSLPGPPEVEGPRVRRQGHARWRPARVGLFDLSTNSLAVVKRSHAAFAERQAHMLDAPAGGGPAGDASGKLALWISGDEAIFKKHEKVHAAIRSGPLYQTDRFRYHREAGP